MNFCSDLAGFFIATTGGLALLFSAYLFGAYSYSHNLWPIELLQQIRNASAGQSTADTVQLSEFDSLGRLTFYPRKHKSTVPFKRKTRACCLFSVSQMRLITHKRDLRPDTQTMWSTTSTASVMSHLLRCWGPQVKAVSSLPCWQIC